MERNEIAAKSLPDQMAVILREISRKDDEVRLSNLEIINNYYVSIFQGITSLLANGVYSAAYPLHDVSDLAIYFTHLLSVTKKSLVCDVLVASSQTSQTSQTCHNCSNFCRFPSFCWLSRNSPHSSTSDDHKFEHNTRRVATEFQQMEFFCSSLTFCPQDPWHQCQETHSFSGHQVAGCLGHISLRIPVSMPQEKP